MSFKPPLEVYQRPETPMITESTYKNSFSQIPTTLAISCRPTVIRPINSLKLYGVHKTSAETRKEYEMMTKDAAATSTGHLQCGQHSPPENIQQQSYATTPASPAPAYYMPPAPMNCCPPPLPPGSIVYNGHIYNLHQ